MLDCADDADVRATGGAGGDDGGVLFGVRPDGFCWDWSGRLVADSGGADCGGAG